MPTCTDFASAEGRTRISPSIPAAAALGGAEQPPFAFTQLLRISNPPSAVSAMARTEVNRSMRTRKLISVIGVSETIQPPIATFEEWMDGQLNALINGLNAGVLGR